jgi:hypothetical protein
MGETTQIILGVVFLIAVYLLTRVGVARRMRSSGLDIARELRARGATSPQSAVRLPYEKADWLKIGLRDYRPKALEALVNAGIVGRTPEGAYWLRDQSVLGD